MKAKFLVPLTLSLVVIFFILLYWLNTIAKQYEACVIVAICGVVGISFMYLHFWEVGDGN